MAEDEATRAERSDRRARREVRRSAALDADLEARIARARRRAVQVDAAIVAGAAKSEIPAPRRELDDVTGPDESEA